MPNLTPEDGFKIIQDALAESYHGKADASLVSKPFALNVKKGQVPDDFNYATEITFNRDIQNFTPFLQMVNILPRKHQKGGSMMVGSQGRVTRTNDTFNGQKRRTGSPKPSTLNEYEMVKWHSDFRIHDDNIEAMSEFPEWKELYREGFFESMGNDMILCGWWGEEHVATSNLTTNSLLQDVAPGWIKLAEERIPTRFLQIDEIKIGTIAENGNDFVSLDHCISYLLRMIPIHRRTAGLTALVSEEVMGYAEGAYYENQAGTPSEKPLIKTKAVTGVYGGLDTIPAPYFPQSAIILTGLKRKGQSRSNLSIYWQKDSLKRSVEYQAEIESSVDWNKRRQAFHIEDLQALSGFKAQKIIFTDYGKYPDDHATKAGEWIATVELTPEDEFAGQ